jgi:hypothetical protein
MEGIVENITPFMMNWDELNKLCKANGVKPMRRRKSVMVDALRAADKLPPGFAGCWQDEEYEEEHADDQESDDDDEPDDDKEEKVDDEEEKVDDEEESERLWAVKNNSRLKSKRRGTKAKARHLAVVAATNATPGPRKLVTLHNLNSSEIILCGMKLKSREAVELLIAERYDSKEAGPHTTDTATMLPPQAHTPITLKIIISVFPGERRHHHHHNGSKEAGPRRCFFSQQQQPNFDNALPFRGSPIQPPQHHHHHPPFTGEPTSYFSSSHYCDFAVTLASCCGGAQRPVLPTDMPSLFQELRVFRQPSLNLLTYSLE